MCVYLFFFEAIFDKDCDDKIKMEEGEEKEKGEEKSKSEQPLVDDGTASCN